MESGVGMTCGNLPPMRPLFRRFFDSTRSGNSDSNYFRSNRSSRMINQSDNARLGSKLASYMQGFEIIDDDSLGDGSDIELNNRRHLEEGIMVTTYASTKER
jgi:hypothetical protein